MRPITKWNARVADAAIIPEVVRKAFKVAETEKPGATHIELPEDVMATEVDVEPLPRRRSVQPDLVSHQPWHVIPSRVQFGPVPTPKTIDQPIHFGEPCMQSR